MLCHVLFPTFGVLATSLLLLCPFNEQTINNAFLYAFFSAIHSIPAGLLHSQPSWLFASSFMRPTNSTDLKCTQKHSRVEKPLLFPLYSCNQYFISGLRPAAAPNSAVCFLPLVLTDYTALSDPLLTCPQTPLMTFVSVFTPCACHTFLCNFSV